MFCSMPPCINRFSPTESPTISSPGTISQALGRHVSKNTISQNWDALGWQRQLRRH
uniref:Uncharacterized protein n=1 Tax=Rhizophora mucronata TaxID=61149 RepID=A0A2P2K5J1_RHIMU